ncbi:MAG: hypothetical protein HY812_12510 [Planctomycetes bacterium]|nr:hypothetical protein [Planctomycetota bacterium]
MLTLWFALLVNAALVQEDGAAAQAPDAKAEVTAACEEFCKLPSYAFELKVETSGGRGGLRTPQAVVGRFQTEKPFHFVQGSVEAYRLGETLVYREGEGEWQVFDPEAARGDFGQPRPGGPGGGGQGAEPGAGAGQGEGAAPGAGAGAGAGEGGGAAAGGLPGAEGAERQGPGQGERGGGRRNMGPFLLSRLKVPHDALKDFGSQIAEVAREEAEGKVTYKGTLTAQAAEALTPQVRGLRPGGGGETEQAPAPQASGSFTITLSDQGAVESIVLETHTSTTFGERTVERTQKNAYTISNQGAVEIEVPAEVLPLFEL